VDTGSNQSVPTSLIADLDGHPRILCDFVDRGAYERGAGDFNCDEHVDLGDYRFWTGCLTGPDANADSASCQAFDYDADGDVDLADHAAFQRASAP